MPNGIWKYIPPTRKKPPEKEPVREPSAPPITVAEAEPPTVEPYQWEDGGFPRPPKVWTPPFEQPTPPEGVETRGDADRWHKEELANLATEYQDVADWTVKGWQERRKDKPERYTEYVLKKEDLWEEYQSMLPQYEQSLFAKGLGIANIPFEIVGAQTRQIAIGAGDVSQPRIEELEKEGRLEQLPPYEELPIWQQLLWETPILLDFERTIIKLGGKAITKTTAKTFSKTFGPKWNKWIATQGRLHPEAQNIIAKAIIDNKQGIVERATDNLLKNLGRTKNVGKAVSQAADDAIRDIETILVPKGTATGITRGGLPTINQPAWDAMAIPERTALATSKGLPEQVASKDWASLTGDEITAITKVPITPEVTPLAEEVVGVAEAIPENEVQMIALGKALINAETGKPTVQYRKLAQNITGKSNVGEMTPDEVASFVEALNQYPERKWSTKTGKWIAQPIPETKALVPENYFNLKFAEPTAAKYLTSQNYYATRLGLGELTQPLEVAKQELDLVFPAWSGAVDSKVKALNKAYKITASEKLIAFRNNLPTRASAEMAKLLNQYEDLPADLVVSLGKEKVELFSWFRNLNRTILNAQNKVRELLNMPPIPHRQAYFRHIATETAKEIWGGNYSLPSDLTYWSKQIVGKKVFNPMEIQRKITDDLLEYFSKDLGYVTKSMLWTGLKEIHLSQPLRAFTTQVNALSKGMMPFSSLSPEDIVRAKAISVLPDSTHKWLVDYVNINIKGQATEFDAAVNRLVTQSGIGGVFDKILKEFGRSIGTRPITKITQFSGRLVISATIGTKPRQIIRNLWQSTQNLALYGIESTLKAFLPANKNLTRLLDKSMFLKSYARYEELPTGVMAKAERAWLWAYGKSAHFNARTGMKASYHGTIDYITNPNNKRLGWSSPERTFTEPNGFLYPEEETKLLREMEFGAAATQYQYIAMGMPEIFRHKTLIPITRLQSWWMNYFFKFNREAIHRYFSGSVGWDSSLKLPWTARLNWFKYVILGGAVLTAMGYDKSFGKDVAPHWASPAGQMMVGAYNYVTASEDWQRENAKEDMFYSMRAFAPGLIDYESYKAIWSGEKPLSSLFFYGEDMPPNEPTWGIPPLEKEVDIKNQIEYANEEIPKYTEKLGQVIPAEDGVDGYTYEMSDLAPDIWATIRDIPPERITAVNGFPPIVLSYQQYQVMFETYMEQPTPRWDYRDENPTVDANLFFWGYVTTLQSVEAEQIVRQMMGQYNIPESALPALEKIKSPSQTGRVIMPPTKPKPTPSPTTSGGWDYIPPTRK